MSPLRKLALALDRRADVAVLRVRVCEGTVSSEEINDWLTEQAIQADYREYRQRRKELTDGLKYLKGWKMVRAKFKVNCVVNGTITVPEKQENGTTTYKLIEASGDAATIYMSPVTEDSPENAEFFRWTPSGQIVLQCLNAEATAQFEVNREYYIDFTPAE